MRNVRQTVRGLRSTRNHQERFSPQSRIEGENRLSKPNGMPLIKTVFWSPISVLVLKKSLERTLRLPRVINHRIFSCCPKRPIERKAVITRDYGHSLLSLLYLYWPLNRQFGAVAQGPRSRTAQDGRRNVSLCERERERGKLRERNVSTCPRQYTCPCLWGFGGRKDTTMNKQDRMNRY